MLAPSSCACGEDMVITPGSIVLASAEVPLEGADPPISVPVEVAVAAPSQSSCSTSSLFQALEVMPTLDKASAGPRSCVAVPYVLLLSIRTGRKV